MTSFAAFLAPLALLLPPAPLHSPAPAQPEPAQPQNGLAAATPKQTDTGPGPVDWSALALVLRPIAHQVRIEQHIILRISPRTREMQDVVSEIRRRTPDVRWVERKTDGCLAMRSLVGVRIGGDDRLVLYTRDRSMFTAQLDGSCSAREFYSGFYVEPSKDGKLCVNRDRLQSRSGASCELSRIARLVPVAD